MKRPAILFFAFIFSFITASATLAQVIRGGMMANNTSTAATSEEAQGKTLWDNLEAGRVACATLVDNDFDLIGEYFMGTMMGASHGAMNDRLKQAFGDAGESQVHVVLGKRMSGCDMSATYPAGFSGFMPMMGGWSSPDEINTTNNSMMNYGYGGMMGGFSTLGFITWLVVIVDLVFLGVWLWKKNSNK